MPSTSEGKLLRVWLAWSGSNLAVLGLKLVGTGAHLGPTWARLAPNWANLGPALLVPKWGLTQTWPSLALSWSEQEPTWAQLANCPLGFAPENGPHQVSSFHWEAQEKAFFSGDLVGSGLYTLKGPSKVANCQPNLGKTCAELGPVGSILGLALLVPKWGLTWPNSNQNG